jgi:hypothetical protein
MKTPKRLAVSLAFAAGFLAVGTATARPVSATPINNNCSFADEGNPGDQSSGVPDWNPPVCLVNP